MGKRVKSKVRDQTLHVIETKESLKVNNENRRIQSTLTPDRIKTKISNFLPNFNNQNSQNRLRNEFFRPHFQTK